MAATLMEIIEIVQQRLGNRTFIVAIDGAGGSGKSTLAALDTQCRRLN